MTAAPGRSPPDGDPEEDRQHEGEEAGRQRSIDVREPEHEEIAGEAAEDPDDFLTLMSHLYRGTLSRALKWRDRLDRTVNWSVLVVASLLTWTFSSASRPHVILLVGMSILVVFLWIEARRYLFFDVWRSQVRVLEENVFAEALEPQGAEIEGWRSRLSRDLRRPAFKITMVEALARRLRRIYLALLGILLAAWLARLVMQSPTIRHVPAVVGVGPIPGRFVLGAVVAFYAGLVGLAFWPRKREAKGHVRQKEEAVDLGKEP